MSNMTENKLNQTDRLLEVKNLLDHIPHHLRRGEGGKRDFLLCE